MSIQPNPVGKKVLPLQAIISQTRKAMDVGLYYIALMSALAVPDIVGALGAEDGEASGKKYADWYNKWGRPRLKESRNRDNPLTGEECWGFRCALLHQGKFKQSKNPKSRKIIFVEPGYPNYSIHYCEIHNNAFLIQIDQFVEEIMRGCELWLDAVRETETFKKNYENFARRHPNGLASVKGVPVVG